MKNMNSVEKIVALGMCTGCGACLSRCIYNPDNDD